MIECSPTKHENEDLVMPAWMAGIQFCKDASGNIHVAWIPAIHAGMTSHGALFKLIEAFPPGIFKGEREGGKKKKFNRRDRQRIPREDRETLSTLRSEFFWIDNSLLGGLGV